MDAFIFGIGCSGTTMIYSLLQSIYSKLYQDDYYSTYEPFIWDKEKFNLPYEKYIGLFGKINSISIEGIYNHLNTPMFVDKQSSADYKDSAFFRHFSPTQGPGQPHLAKFIRANGRMALLRALNPRARFLLVIRNPVDNINCVKHKFSFFGEDFHPSDFPRFCEQLQQEKKLVLNQKNAGWAQRQAEYCYQMNRVALQFAASDKNTRVLEYDSFTQNLQAAVLEVCKFLNTPFSDHYVEGLQRPVGPTTTSRALSQSEYEAILRYDNLYSSLCEQSGVRRGKDTNDIRVRYDGKCSSSDLDTAYEGLTTNRLRNIIRVKDNSIRQLKKLNESN